MPPRNGNEPGQGKGAGGRNERELVRLKFECSYENRRDELISFGVPLKSPPKTTGELVSDFNLLKKSKYGIEGVYPNTHGKETKGADIWHGHLPLLTVGRIAFVAQSETQSFAKQQLGIIVNQKRTLCGTHHKHVQPCLVLQATQFTRRVRGSFLATSFGPLVKPTTRN